MEQEEIESVQDKVQEIRDELHKGIIGQEEVVDMVIKSLLCNSHSLLEGVPGLGKTLLVRLLASVSSDTAFKRIQFTPDLLPSDVTGTRVYQEDTGEFKVQEGPVFTNFLLADEINRSPPKVQTALLESMEEHEATIGNETLDLPDPFFVLATQNPLEQQGTFPLSIAQRDRFIFKIIMDYPREESEYEIIEENLATQDIEDLELRQVVEPSDLIEMQKTVKNIDVSEEVEDYIMDIIEATRKPGEYSIEIDDYLEYGVSPRASIFTLLASRATALMHGRTYVTVDDVQEVVPHVLRHRLILTYQARAENMEPIGIVETLLNEITVS